ncbi:MAG TPA: hypothetical protein DCX53_12125 [Anaerolineae bacterium]|nr:hypothetical protein [Anaerolineae bacterium]
MKRKTLFLFLILTILSACSNGQVASQEVSSQPIEAPLLSQPTIDSAQPTVDSPIATPAIPTSTPKPPLAKDEWMTWPAVPTGVSDSMHDVYQLGLDLGNDPTHFSVIGDCQNVSSYFLSTFENPDDYSLGEKYAYLLPTIEYYQGSYSRESVAVKGGFNAAAVISPLRADPEVCNPNESPLDCELRIWRPSVVIVSMETWWSQKPEEEYEKYMRRVLDRIIETGAVPIIATKADNLEGEHAINNSVAKLAYEYDIPLWNYWAAVQPLPDHGLSKDGFHLTFGRNFFDDPIRMMNAWPWRNLTALQTLDVVRRSLMD